MTRPKSPHYIEFCRFCGKKLKGNSRQGLKKSRTEHYKKAHEIAVQSLTPDDICMLFKPHAAVSAFPG